MVYYVLYSSTRHTPSGLLLSNPGNIPLRSSLLTGDQKRYHVYLVEKFMDYYVLYSSTRHTPSGLLLSNPGNIPQRSSLLTGDQKTGFFLPSAGFELVRSRYYTNPF